MNLKIKMGIFYSLDIIIILTLFTELIRVSQEVESATVSYLSLGILAFFFGLRHAVDADI